ncbi:hypothetical protein GCM10020220_092680 [Nonomuraea rubra]|uniref:acyl carrier protein n=1 Tax=Nonomuraea rubra TaxID=46180 RepID=UPI0031E67200
MRELTARRPAAPDAISAGEDESTDLDGDIIDAGFRDLGYDSLAVLELASRLERDWGVVVPDEVAATLETPRAVLDYVNERAAVK